MKLNAIPPTEYILSLKLKKNSLLNLLIRPNEMTTLDPRKPKAETRLHYTAHDIELLRAPSTQIPNLDFLFFFCLKKFKNEPIAGSHVSVEPTKQCKIRRLFHDRRQPSLPFWWAPHHLFPQKPSLHPALRVL